MAAMKTLSSVLPEPKYRENTRKVSSERDDGDDDAAVTDTRITVKTSGAPAYGHRSGWIPRTLDDYGDGGSFPEISIAQYPLEMGKKKSVRIHWQQTWTNQRVPPTPYKCKSMNEEIFSTMPSFDRDTMPTE